ncbi:hypothetical protein HMP0721_2390 [Pseudoramibacter alactolyticus ATCC 23263]|uniref:Uncharacterized protein n=1 Tax=Pseudoramibacter alactolyticus ATCC 23263 TaxID=887929 RepID=E6MK54_9FIRM|nr:hypothetical protein HMP0721_2390 [Pseudoramibacter alactolyticus ATCC 23263]
MTVNKSYEIIKKRWGVVTNDRAGAVRQRAAPPNDAHVQERSK